MSWNVASCGSEPVRVAVGERTKNIGQVRLPFHVAMSRGIHASSGRSETEPATLGRFVQLAAGSPVSA